MIKCAVIVLNTSRIRNTVQIQIFSTYKIQIICSPTIISSYQRIQVKTQYPALSKTDGHYTISHQASTQTLQKVRIQRSTHICFHPLNKVDAPSPETRICNFLDGITMHNSIFLFCLQLENLCNIFRETTNTSCILIKGQQSVKFLCVIYIICGNYKK